MTVTTGLVANTTLSFDDNDRIKRVVGPADEHIRWLERTLNIQITANGNSLHIKGDNQGIKHGKAVLTRLYAQSQSHHTIAMEEVEAALLMTKNTFNADPGEIKPDNNPEAPLLKTRKKLVEPRSPRQVDFLKAMQQSTIVFATGPAGTGKTYLAVAQAVVALETAMTKRVVLCRPAIEAGEQLGFLPGDMREKVDPYFRPLYDALNELMGSQRLEKFIDNGQIEIAPLAFMRGRTLSEAFIILDEAQNCNSLQMKMLLTRIGQGSHLVICGDPGQSDLPKGQKSGLSEAVNLLTDIDGIEEVAFGEEDIVRHALVGAIIRAYRKQST